MWRVASAFLLLPVMFCTAASQDDYEKYVFSIRIENKDGSSFVQTGFRLSGQKGIVTALHGAVMGNHLSAANEQEKVIGGLYIRFVDVARDLAMLGSDKLDSENADGLPAGSGGVAQSKVVIPGHPQGIALNVRTQVTVGSQVRSVLSKKIPPSIWDVFSKRGSPAAQIDVINLEGGSLQPGESGAPVLQNGGVIGVEDGGLSGGSGIGWAIPLPDVHWTPASDASQQLATLAANQTDLLFDMPSARSTSLELEAKLAYVGVWKAVAFEEGSSPISVIGQPKGKINVTIDQQEELHAQGSFALNGKVTYADTRLGYADLRPGMLYRVEGTVNGIGGVSRTIHTSSHGTFDGRFTHGEWDGTSWTHPRIWGQLRTTRSGGFICTEGNPISVGGGPVCFEQIDDSESTSTDSLESHVNTASFRVVGVGDDGLNARSGPGTKNRIQFNIPSDATGITVTGDSSMDGPDEWVPIEWASQRGWVNRRFLTEVVTSE